VGTLAPARASQTAPPIHPLTPGLSFRPVTAPRVRPQTQLLGILRRGRRSPRRVSVRASGYVRFL